VKFGQHFGILAGSRLEGFGSLGPKASQTFSVSLYLTCFPEANLPVRRLAGSHTHIRPLEVDARRDGDMVFKTFVKLQI